MAATLTDTGELTYLSFGIDKVESTPDGDLLCYGRATDGSVDHDQQIVDPSFSSKSIRDWLESGGNVRVQHNAQRDPAGVGLEVNTDADGATWVKSLIVEPVAKKLLTAGALRAYSVGIARPTIVRDAVAKGGRITAGEIVEISLVDRPANARCGVQLVKSAGDGTPEYTGKVFGSDDEIAKALNEPAVAKSAHADASAPAPGTVDISRFEMPQDLNVTITPNDIMRVMQAKFVSQHYDELAVKAIAEAEAALLGKDHREFSADERRHQASAGNALPDGSYPIPDKDALRRAAILARSGHGNVAAARRLIARRARELGVANPLDESDDVKKDLSREEEAAVTKSLAALDAFAGAGSKEEAVAALKNVAAAVKGAAAKVSAEEAEALLASGKYLTVKQIEDMPADELRALLAKADAPAETDAAVPDVTKDPKPKPVKKAKKKPKKMPPWLNKPKDGDSDSDGDSKGDSDDDADKSVQPVTCKSGGEHVWVRYTDGTNTSEVQCQKCHTTPAQAAGVAGSHDMSPAPVGDLMESQGPASTKGATPASASGAVGESMKPVPAHREPDGDAAEAFERDAGMEDGDSEKTAVPDLAPNPEVAALLRFKAAGADEDLGRLHDLTCPAYHPETVARYHPYADLGSLIDSRAWQRKTLAAASGPLEASLKAQEVWQAALLLKTADTADLNQWRLELHKAFRDANPGPGSFPTPGSVSPQRYSRPVLTDGRAANSTAYGTPNSSPQVATTAPNAQSFDRPPLSAGHQSPSPSHMKWDSGQYPSERGVPTQLSYAQMEKEQQRMALVRMHDHLSRQFPEVCPLNTVDSSGLEDRPLRGVQPEHHPVPPAAGIGKSDSTGWTHVGNSDLVTIEATPVAAFKATPEDADMFTDADIYKAFKKMRKKLGKRVLSGKMTVDEARAKLGRQFTQKGESGGAIQKAAAPHEVTVAAPPVAAIQPVNVDAALPFSPDVIKSAVAEATADLKDLLIKQQQDMAAQQEDFTAKLAEQQRVIDAIADQPDPSTAAFSGLAFQPQTIKSRRPAGVPDQAEYAARAQAMIRRNLEHTYQTHSNPVVREKAAEALATFGVEATPMT